MNYIDVKVIVWNRFLFADQSNMQGLADLVQGKGIGEVIDKQLGFVGSDILPDSGGVIFPDVDNQQSTIRVYEADELIWQNGKSV